MQVTDFLHDQLVSYGLPVGAAFAAVAFACARFAGWAGVVCGHTIIAITVFVLDVHWIGQQMRAPGWDGQPDMDIVFDFAVLMRILLINTLLLPVSAFGMWLRYISRGNHNEAAVPEQSHPAKSHGRGPSF